MLGQVCEREGIPVVLEAPSVNDLDRWEGAFVTSTSRLVLVIDELTVCHGAVPTQTRSFGEQRLLQRIEALVLDDIAKRSEPFTA